MDDSTSRIITIATECNDENFGICHPQDQSPLFTLPKELRLMIYDFERTLLRLL